MPKFKTPIFIFTCFFLSLFSQTDYIILESENSFVSKETKELLKSKPIEIQTSVLINNHFKVKIDGKYTLSDSKANLIDGRFDYVTNLTKQNLFFSGTQSYAPNDYGKREVFSITNIKTHNYQSESIASQISAKSNYYFATNQLHVFKFYSSKDSDYLTIHQTIDGEKQKEGLINGSGEILIEPNHEYVKQVFEDFFLLKKGEKKILKNVSSGDILDISVEDIKKYSNTLENVPEYIAFENNIILKSNNKYGIYNLIEKKWMIPNVYNDINVVIERRQLDKKVLKSSVLLKTKIFVVKKDEKWGAVSADNEELIPFQFEKIERTGNGLFNVINSENKVNKFDLTTKKLLFENFYDKIQINYNNENIVLIEDNKKIALYDSKTDEWILDFDKNIISYEHFNSEKLYLFKMINPQSTSKYDKFTQSLYAVVTNKVIAENIKNATKVEYSKDLVSVTDNENNRSIIDNTGKIIVTPQKLLGKAYYSKKLDKIKFYFPRKPKDIKHCFNMDGSEVKAKTCQ